MTPQATKYLRYSQVSFVACVAVCVWLTPEVFFSHSGISYFGNFRHTLAPYLLGLGLTSYFMYKASVSMLDGPKAVKLRRALQLNALLLLGVMLTPSYASPPIRALHLFFGPALFALQIVVSYKLARLQWTGLRQRMLLAAQTAAVVITILSFRHAHVLSLMIPAQTVAIVAFSQLLIGAAKRLVVVTEQQANMREPASLKTD